MKKVLLSVALLMAIACGAQAQKRVSGFTFSMSEDMGGQTLTINGKGTLTYNENSELASIGLSATAMGYQFDLMSQTFTYGNNTITSHANVMADEGSVEYTVKSDLSDGLVQTDTYTTSTGKTFSYDYTYTDGHLTEMEGTNEDGKAQYVKLTWTDGNISKIEEYENNELVSTITAEYTDLAFVPEVTWLSPIFDPSLLTEYNSIGLLPIKEHGLTCKNLPSKVTYDVTNDESENNEFTYTLNDDNYVTDVKLYDTESDMATYATFSWEDDPTSINGVNTTEDGQPSAIYNINGQRTNNLTHGMNILRMKDGKTRKVMVK